MINITLRNLESHFARVRSQRNFNCAILVVYSFVHEQKAVTEGVGREREKEGTGGAGPRI